MSGYQASSIEREIFAGISDILIPAAEGMPAASEINVAGPMLDRVLELRSDLTEAFCRGIASAEGISAKEATLAMNENDPQALTAIGNIASAIYYMDASVRKLIGYPGQTSRPVLAAEEEDWHQDNLLGPVIARGAIYRSTPG